jgi:hypothetical protein
MRLPLIVRAMPATSSASSMRLPCLRRYGKHRTSNRWISLRMQRCGGLIELALSTEHQYITASNQVQ